MYGRLRTFLDNIPCRTIIRYTCKFTMGRCVMLLQKERELVAGYGRRLITDRLTTGTSGNISIYNAEKGLMAISPSGIDYFKTEPEDVVVTDLDANVVEGNRRPSSEWALHTLFYRTRPDVRSVVHCHSVYCTTFAVLHQSIKAVHFILAEAGTDEVPCAPYVTFGTKELAEQAVTVCGKGNAVLLANHGQLVCGTDIAAAYRLAADLEYTAELQYRASCIGNPSVLSASDITAALERFGTYGQPPVPDAD